MKTDLLTLASVTALFIGVSWACHSPETPASEPLGRFNIMIEYLDDKGTYDVLTNVGYALEPNLLIIHQGGSARLVPLYGIEHIRIIPHE